MKRYAIYISLGIMVILLGGAIGYFIGYFLISDTQLSNNSNTDTVYAQEESTPVQSNPSESIYYMLKFENEKLFIYEIIGGNSNIINEFSINIDDYPEMDRLELIKGIQTDNLNNALEMAENFTS